MYVQGFLLAVPDSKKDAYTRMANDAGDYFKTLGAIEIVENWEVDVPDGKHTDFRTAVKAEPDEKIVFSWVIWPDKQTCDDAAKKMEEGGMEPPDEMPFDGKRMIWGGFEPVYSTGR